MFFCAYLAGAALLISLRESRGDGSIRSMHERKIVMALLR